MRVAGLRASADAAVNCLGVGATDEVLVVHNDEQQVVAGSFAAAYLNREHLSRRQSHALQNPEARSPRVGRFDSSPLR